MLEHLDWLALAVGTVGTVLWAHNGAWAKYAAVWWLASSLLWVGFAWHQGMAALGIRDAISMSLYLYGGWRWLVKRPDPVAVEGGTVSVVLEEGVASEAGAA